MIFIVPREVDEVYGIKVEEGQKTGLIREILNTPTNNYVVDDKDIDSFLQVCDFLEIQTKVVISIPDVHVSSEATFISDSEKLIVFSEFVKEYNEIFGANIKESIHFEVPNADYSDDEE